MANVSYDTLTIEINADSKQANKSIRSLSNNLSHLEDVAKTLDIKAIKNVQKCLQDISKIDFTNVSNGLKDVVSAFKQISGLSSKRKPTDPLEQAKAISLMTGAGKGFSQGQEPNWSIPELETGKIKVFDDLVKGDTLFNQTLDTTKQRLQSIGFSMEQIGQFEKMGEQNRKFQEMVSLLQSVGLNAEQARKAIKKLEGGEEGGKGGGRGSDPQKSMGKLQKLAKAFGRVLFYRIVRRIIQLVAQAIKQGIQNLAKFSEDFNKTMSNIKSSVVYLKNTIGAVAMPLIQMLEPYLVQFIDTIADKLNYLAEVLSAVAGKDTFIKATKSAEDYARALNKVNLSIDELNVIDKGASFEEVAVSDEAVEKAKDIKELFGDVKQLIKDVLYIANEFRPLIKYIIFQVNRFLKKILPKIHELLEAIRPIIEKIVNFVIQIMEGTSETVEDSLTSAVGLITKIFNFIDKIATNFMPLIQSILNVIMPIINLINDILDYLFTILGKIIDAIGDWLIPVIGACLIPLSAILNVVATILEFLDAIVKSFKAIITLDWGSLGNIWSNFAERVKNSWSNWYDSLQQNDVVNKTTNVVSSLTDTPASGGYENAFAQYLDSREYANNTDVYVKVYLDSEEIAYRIEKRQANKGQNNYSGGVLTYGK